MIHLHFKTATLKIKLFKKMNILNSKSNYTIIQLYNKTYNEEF